MILNDLSQAMVTTVYNLYAEAAHIENRQPPIVDAVRIALEGESKRYVVPAPAGNIYKAELWYAEDVNKNIIFSFVIPTDLSKTDLAAAEAAKADFDQRLQQYLVDYYV